MKLPYIPDKWNHSHSFAEVNSTESTGGAGTQVTMQAIWTQSYPIFQDWSCCASMCAASYGNGAVSEVFSRYGNMCSLIMGLLCGYTRAVKLDRTGPSYFIYTGKYYIQMSPQTTVFLLSRPAQMLLPNFQKVFRTWRPQSYTHFPGNKYHWIQVPGI